MATIAIVGDGPGGLSAALFLAKNGQETVVYGEDETAMHYALLKNYLGITEVPGPEFQTTALQQVEAFGAEIRRAHVTAVSAGDEGFEVTADDGTSTIADYLILAEGRNAPLAESLGVATDDGAISVDTEYRTSLPRLYVVGRAARPQRSQAIISAGAGATAALDILADVNGGDFKDWDSLPKEG